MSILRNFFWGNPKKKKPFTRPKRRKRKIPVRRPSKIINDIERAIDKNGCCSIKLYKLYGQLGYKRRGASNILKVQKLLDDHRLYSFPRVDDLSVRWDQNVKIYKFPVEKSGDLFDREKALEHFVKKANALNQLNVHNIQQQYSPDFTKDKLDIFGKTDDKNVVVELKNKGGGKSAVEQVLRYAGMLKQESPEKEVRKILITGIRSLATAKAIHGMRPEEKEQFEWYLYKYDKAKETIKFERVSHQFLERHLGRKKHRVIRSN